MSTIKPPLISLAEHPRAAAAIRRAKASGGIAGLVLAGLGSWMHGATVLDVGVRALGGGIVGYMLTWAAAVMIWRHLILAETKVAVARAVETRRRRAAQQAGPPPA
jgi:hypothetical protein